jgi:malate dehydrogenase (oxaloacetate-decarboxylating)(NADP+)
VAPAIAIAAMNSGVARQQIEDMNKYVEHLESTQGKSKEIMRMIINKAKSDPKRIVFPEGDNEKIIRAAKELVEEGIAKPILIGDRNKISQQIKNLNIELDVLIVDPAESELTEKYARVLYQMRQRKGLTLSESQRLLRRKSRTHFGAMMVHMGDADALLGGIDTNYPETIRPALEVVGKQSTLSSVHGLYMLVSKDNTYFLADATVTIDPTPEELAETAILAAEKVRMLDIEPRVAMLSFSNFGSVKHPQVEKVRKATEIVKQKAPTLIVDGEMQADTAVVPELLEGFTFSKLSTCANILIFPDLNSGNICYKLLHHLGGAEGIGPILMGMNKPIHVLQRGNSVDDIVKIAAIAVVDVNSSKEFSDS